MDGNRTGLSAADIAEQLRDVCGDDSVEWVYTPMQAWVLLDAADMLDENDKLREEVRYLKKGDVLHVLTDQEFAEQQKHEREMQASIKALDDENAKLRELVRDMWGCISHIGEYDVFYYDMAKDGCGVSCTVNGEHCCANKLHDRMRELGVDA